MLALEARWTITRICKKSPSSLFDRGEMCVTNIYWTIQPRFIRRWHAPQVIACTVDDASHGYYIL